MNDLWSSVLYCVAVNEMLGFRTNFLPDEVKEDRDTEINVWNTLPSGGGAHLSSRPTERQTRALPWDQVEHQLSLCLLMYFENMYNFQDAVPIFFTS